MAKMIFVNPAVVDGRCRGDGSAIRHGRSLIQTQREEYADVQDFPLPMV